MDDMENCDTVNALGGNLIMRVGSGEERAILLWNLKETGGIDEESLNEIELTEEDRKLHEQATTFEIKSGIVVGADKGDLDRDKEQHVLLFVTPEGLRFR